MQRQTQQDLILLLHGRFGGIKSMLTATTNIVSSAVLKELVAAGSVITARLEVADKGLVIVVRAGMNERVLGASRGGARYFQSLDGAASVLQTYGINRFECDTAHWVSKSVKAKK